MQYPNVGSFSSLTLQAVTAGWVTISVPTTVTPYEMFLPAGQGAAGTTLVNDGAGNLSWSDAFSGPVTTSGVYSTNVPIATAGFMRLGNTDAIEWRDSTNTSNLTITMEGASLERFIFNNAIVSQKSTNGLVRSLISNPNSGASAQVQLSLTTSADDFDYFANGSGAGASCGFQAGAGYTGGFNIGIAGNNSLTLLTNALARLAINGAGVTTLHTTNSGGQLRFVNAAASGHFNFQIGSQINASDAFEICPSTAADGTTFSTPVFIAASAGVLVLGPSGGTPQHQINTHTTTGAQAATITNSPTAGNPTGFIQITINGTQSYIPFWQ